MMLPEIDSRSGRASNGAAAIRPQTIKQPLPSGRNSRPQFASWDDALASGSIAVSSGDARTPPRLRLTAARRFAPRTARRDRVVQQTGQDKERGRDSRSPHQQGGTL